MPSSYVQNTRNSGGGNGLIIATKIAASASESAPSFANATQVIAAVYRSTAGKVLVASSGSVGSANSLSVIYPQISFSGSNIAEKWHAGIAGHRSNDTNLETAPTGMTNRISQVGASAGHLVLHDSNAHQTSWGGETASLSGTSNIWRSAVIEILELDVEYPTGGGIYNPFRPPVFGGG